MQKRKTTPASAILAQQANKMGIVWWKSRKFARYFYIKKKTPKSFESYTIQVLKISLLYYVNPWQHFLRKSVRSETVTPKYSYKGILEVKMLSLKSLEQVALERRWKIFKFQSSHHSWCTLKIIRPSINPVTHTNYSLQDIS